MYIFAWKIPFFSVKCGKYYIEYSVFMANKSLNKKAIVYFSRIQLYADANF